MRDDTVYLRHIMERIRHIKENIAAGRDRFMASYTLQDAVLRNLQTMTESVQRLSEALKATRPEVEWKRIISSRNVLVHNYLGVDLQRIWEIIQRDVPELKRAISSMLNKKL
ncbi:MAG: DUF86 domain-containing protein [Ignavibacteriales bacterium]